MKVLESRLRALLHGGLNFLLEPFVTSLEDLRCSFVHERDLLIGTPYADTVVDLAKDFSKVVR
jgi:hypothetical protein